MSNEITLYGSNQTSIIARRNNYEIEGCMGGVNQVLVRDVDFGVLPKTKKPTLLKSGAEKIIKAYGLLTRFTIESKIEQVEPSPLFLYNVKCELVKIHPDTGKEYIFATGYGSGNTSERRNGMQSAYDGANSALKMASKRAMVMAAITIGGISDLFEQDIESESFMAQSDKISNNLGDDAPITSKQMKRIFALASQAGYSAEEAKNKIVALGFSSTKDVTQGKYDEVCELFQKKE